MIGDDPSLVTCASPGFGAALATGSNVARAPTAAMAKTEASSTRRKIVPPLKCLSWAQKEAETQKRFHIYRAGFPR
jgi:hypothetical protein